MQKIIVEQVIQTYLKEQEIEKIQQQSKELDKLSEKEKEARREAEDYTQLQQANDQQLQQQLEQQQMMKDLTAHEQKLDAQLKDIDANFEKIHTEHHSRFMEESENFKLPSGRGLLDGVDKQAYHAKSDELLREVAKNEKQSEREIQLILESVVQRLLLLLQLHKEPNKFHSFTSNQHHLQVDQHKRLNLNNTFLRYC